MWWTAVPLSALACQKPGRSVYLITKILIAEDHEELRKLWAINLSVRNFEVIEAGDGQECLMLIQREHPDIVLLDLSMPVLSGWAVLEAIQEFPAQGRPLVIIVTGRSDGELESKARELGADRMLFKPFGIDRLLQAINAALGGGEG